MGRVVAFPLPSHDKCSASLKKKTFFLSRKKIYLSCRLGLADVIDKKEMKKKIVLRDPRRWKKSLVFFAF